MKRRGSIFTDRVIRDVKPSMIMELELGQPYQGGEVIVIDRARRIVTVRVQRPR